MYLKTLEVLSGAKVIRTITFHSGLNLIIGVSDNAQSDSGGNAVGKTTVLKLIDFCFGGGVENIYTDHEKEERNVNTSLKEFLIKEKISVRLCLCNNLHSSENDIYIERSCFKAGKNSYTVNGLPVSSKMKLPDGRSILELIFGHF